MAEKFGVSSKCDKTVESNPIKIADAYFAASTVALDKRIPFLKSRSDKEALPAAAQPTKAPKVEQVLCHSTTTPTYLANNAVTNLLKAASQAAKAGAAAVPAAANVAGSADAVAGYAVGLASTAAKHSAAKRKEKNTAQTAHGLYDEGKAYLLSEGKGANPDAYVKFTKAMAPLTRAPGMSKSATGDERVVLGSNVARYTLATVGAAATLTGAAVSVAAAVAAPVASGFSLGAAFAELAGAVKTLIASKRQAKTLKQGAQALQTWGATNRPGGLPVAGLQNACSTELGRRQRLLRWSKRTARVQIFKASATIGVSVASTIMFSLAAAGLLAGTVLTGGIALAAVGAAITGGCLAYAAIRAVRQARTERHVKRRQRQSEALIASHSIPQLKALMAEPDPSKRRCKITTYERKAWFTRDRHLRTREVDVGANGYVGLHVMADHLAGMLEGKATLAAETPVLTWLSAPDAAARQAAADKFGIDADSAALLQMLVDTGMRKFDIHAVCHAASLLPHAQRVAYLKETMAKAIGLPYQAEKPVYAYLGLVQQLMTTPPKTVKPPVPRRTGAPRRPDNALQVDGAHTERTARQFFAHANLDELEAAMKTLPDRTIPQVAMAHRLLNREIARRKAVAQSGQANPPL